MFPSLSIHMGSCLAKLAPSCQESDHIASTLTKMGWFVLCTVFTVLFFPLWPQTPFIDYFSRSAQLSFHVFFLYCLHISISWWPGLHFTSFPQDFCHWNVDIHGGSSQKCSGNTAFTPLSPHETLQEHIEHRNKHIWCFCSQEHPKALHEKLMSPLASTLLCCTNHLNLISTNTLPAPC